MVSIKRTVALAAFAAVGVGLGVAALPGGAGAQERPADKPAPRDRDTNRDDTKRDERPADRRDDTVRDRGVAGTLDADRYMLDERITMVTDNDAIPPTLFGHFPSRGTLSFVGVSEVLNGRMGDVRLDGARFAFFGRAAGDWKRGKRYDALSLYLDDASTSEQRRALGAIFRSEETLRSDGMIPLSVVKITLDRPGAEPTGPTAVKIGDRGEFAVTPMKGRDGRNPIGIVNGFSLFEDKEPVLLGTATANYSDHGRSLRVTNGAAEIHYARMSGSVKGIVEEEGGTRRD